MPGWLDPSATRVRLKEAQEEEARAAFAAEMAELQASHERAREMLAEVKYELAWRRLCREFGYVPNQQLDRKWDGQPRDRGRFSFGKMPTLLSNPAFLAPAVRVAIGAQKALERALALFSAMSARNNPDSTAALEINTRVHEPGTTPEDPWVSVKQLTKEQMNSVPSATKSKNSSTMRQPSTDHKIFRALLIAAPPFTRRSSGRSMDPEKSQRTPTSALRPHCWTRSWKGMVRRTRSASMSLRTPGRRRPSAFTMGRQVRGRLPSLR